MKLEKWHFIAAGVLFLILAGLIFLTSDLRFAVSLPEVVIREVLAPLQNGASALAQSAARMYDTVASVKDAVEENRALREEVAALRAQLHAAEVYRIENERLKELLDLEQRLDHPSVPARVIARSPQNWFGTITINRGSRAGLSPGLPVVSVEGAVGQVVNVTPNTAQVVLLVDAKSAVGGVVYDSQTPVLVEGVSDPAGRELRVRSLVRDGVLAPGDEVTTGGSSVFPKGIPIGVITEVLDDPTGLGARAKLAPYVDFGRLEWLTVLLETDGEVAWRGDDESAGSPPASEEAP